MTLLDFDSFDTGFLNPSWLGDSAVLDTATKRTGIASMRLSTANKKYKSFSPKSELIAGFGHLQTSSFVGYPIVSLFGDTYGTRHLSLMVNFTTNLWEIRRGMSISPSTGTVLATGADTVVLNRWYYIEIRATISDTVGVFQVWIDGVLTFDFIGDTKNAGTNSTIDALELSGQSGGAASHFDDFYMLDTAGSVNNARLGDVDVVALRPSGNGSSSQYVGSDGNSVDNYALVDDSPTPGADYVGSTTIGNRDLYAMEDAPAIGSTVKATRVAIYGKKAANGLASIKPLSKVGATVRAETARALSTTDASYYGAVQETDPTGAAWTISNLNGSEVGVEVA